MKPEDGIVHIALGLGKTVVEGDGRCVFAPGTPRCFGLFDVEGVLAMPRGSFYSLNLLRPEWS